MPGPTSRADIISNWETLLEGVQRSPEQPTMETERQSLAQILTELKELKARQEELLGQRQEVTQKIRATLTNGREAASRLRSIIKAKIGPKSERLAHFKIAPFRKRPRKPAEVPPDGEAPGASPDGSTSPPDQPVA